MRIAINTRFLLPNRMEGLGLYTHEVCKRLVKNHPEDEFIFYFDRPFDEKYIYGDNVTPKVVSPPARHPLLWYIWFEWALVRQLNKDKPDVFLSPDGFLPLSYKGRKIMVIHDLGFEHYPKHVSSLVGWYYRKYTPLYAQSADHIFTVSKSTKLDVVKQYNIDEDIISIAYNGVREGFKPLTGENKQNVRQKYSGGNQYFLFVGAMHPRKNVPALLAAFELYKKESNSQHKLLLTGRKAWMTSDIERVFNNMQFGKDVVFLDYLEVDDLKQVTGAASVCVYPSLFEGFGVPLLEAMNCGIPIVASNVSCMPEILGDAAILIDPKSPENIAEAMKKVISDDKLSLVMVEKGFLQAKRFSWDETAEKIYRGLRGQ